MKLYTVLVLSGPEDGTIYPSICYNGKQPILTQYKHIAEFERNKLAEWAAEWAPAAEYKIGEVNV